tara:strand:+ start:413 stop:1069 length:657 start_codon:yes stop_codon:yes gene_type:complete
MSFKKLHFIKSSPDEMGNQSSSYYKKMIERRTVREFSKETFPIEILYDCIMSASSAPSGANKQPWHFVIIKDPKVKNKIRGAAEIEEKEFYTRRATKQWLEDLNQFGTDWNKPFLEDAPYLIVVFSQIFDEREDGSKTKNYYVSESVGIATGFLISALHNAGLVTLTHTPSPMGFLSKILKRPSNERAFVIIPVGFPHKDAKVPTIKKKSFKSVCTVI